MTTQLMAQGNAGIVDVEGARLRYRIEGRGQPCLVVGLSIFYSRVFSQQLREHLQLAMADLRESAAASHPSFTPDRISIDTYADDIEQVRQTLGLTVRDRSFHFRRHRAGVRPPVSGACARHGSDRGYSASVGRRPWRRRPALGGRGIRGAKRRSWLASWLS